MEVLYPLRHKINCREVAASEADRSYVDHRTPPPPALLPSAVAATPGTGRPPSILRQPPAEFLLMPPPHGDCYARRRFAAADGILLRRRMIIGSKGGSRSRHCPLRHPALDPDTVAMLGVAFDRKTHHRLGGEGRAQSRPVVRGHTRRDGHFALNFALLCLNTQEPRLRDLCFGGDRVQPAAGLPMSMSLITTEVVIRRTRREGPPTDLSAMSEFSAQGRNSRPMMASRKTRYVSGADCDCR